MVGCDDVDHAGIFVVLLGQLRREQGVRCLAALIGGLPDVVEQSGALDRLDVQLQLRRQEAGQRCHLLGVGKLILGVAVPELQPADHPHQLGMKPGDPQLKAGLLPRLPNVLLDLLRDLLHRLLDPGRMDPPVLDQTLDGHPGDLPPDRIEPGEDDGLGGVVHDDVDPRRLLQGADVPALPPDDTTLHVVAGEIHHRDGRLGHVLGGNPADRPPDDLLRAILPCLGGCIFDALDVRGGVEFRLLLQRPQELILGLLGREARQLLQLPPGLTHQLLPMGFLLADGLIPGVQLLLPDGHLALAAIHQLQLPIQDLLALVKPLLEALGLLPPSMELLFEFRPGPERLVFDLEIGLFAPRLDLALGIPDDPLRLFLRILLQPILPLAFESPAGDQSDRDHPQRHHDDGHPDFHGISSHHDVASQGRLRRRGPTRSHTFTAPRPPGAEATRNLRLVDPLRIRGRPPPTRTIRTAHTGEGRTACCTHPWPQKPRRCQPRTGSGRTGELDRNQRRRSGWTVSALREK